jgi:16S rRNA (cytosine967-C5)-methyltransferase
MADPAEPARRAETPARVAYQVLRRVESGEAYATLALDGALRKCRLPAGERAVVPELVYGVLRQRTRLDRALAAHAPRGLGQLAAAPLAVLRIAAYQILCSRLPAPLAVDAAVRDMRALAGEGLARFANAVLRKLATAGEPPPPLSLASRLEEVHSLPGWIAGELMRALDGDEAEVEAAAAAFASVPPVALRVALDRASRESVAAEWQASRPDAVVTPSPLLPEALLVSGGGQVEAHASFQDGRCTVQDVGAQLVAHLTGVGPGEVILDACSGVGGKAAHLATLARIAGHAVKIDAADTSARKLDLAQDSARRLGVADVIRTVAVDLTDPAACKARLAPSYDRVILDAPCSGLGVLRRHPELKWRLDGRQIAGLVDLQARLLDVMATLVRPGGVLVYSVCTFTEREGPAQVAAFLARTPGFTLREQRRTWPHRENADAFFMARLERGHDQK